MSITPYIYPLSLLEGIVDVGVEFSLSLSLMYTCSFWPKWILWAHAAIIAAHTMPLLYEKHGDSIDNFANIALKEVANQYKLFDEAILSKIPRKQPSLRKRD